MAPQSRINNQKSRILLYGRSPSQLQYDMADCFCERPIQRAATGALMASSSKALRDAGDIELAFAAQTDPVAPVGQLAKERGDLDSANRENIIHQAFAVFFGCAASLHLFLRHPYIADMALKIEIA